MISVVVAIHLLIAVAMIALILLQKTEGNAAGGGFSVSSVTAMMQPRARPNAIGRATTLLGIAFFATSLGLALLARNVGPAAPSILETPATEDAAAPKVTDILSDEAKPADQAPAAPIEAAPTETKPAAPPAVPTVPNN